MKPPRAPLTLAVGAATLLLALVPAAELLEYRRAEVLGGQAWRLLTGQLVHVPGEHLVLGLAAFVLLGLRLEHELGARFARLLLVSFGGVALGLLAIGEGLSAYRGLSGVASALHVALALRLLAGGRRRGALGACAAGLALSLFAAKLGFEMATGTALFCGDLAGGRPVPLVHVVGGVAGAVGLIGGAGRGLGVERREAMAA